MTRAGPSAGVCWSEPPEQGAPALPIERPIVAATLAIVEAKVACDRVATVLLDAARDHDAVYDAYVSAQRALTASWEHYKAYQEIRSCQGQA